MRHCSATKLVSTISNKGTYGLHNITTIHTVTGVEFDICAVSQLVFHYDSESFGKPLGGKICDQNNENGEKCMAINIRRVNYYVVDRRGF